VLDNVSEQIRECLEAAENCARKASTLPDSSGATLARAQGIEYGESLEGIEFGESLDRFTKNNPRPNITPAASRRPGPSGSGARR
jgi:hypothetical protein